MNRVELAQTFIAVVDQGSIIRAAKKLRQTSAAISKKLTKLEEHLKAQLLHRDRKGAQLTEIGQRYYYEVKQALEYFQKAEAIVTQSHIVPEGSLKVLGNHYYVESRILPRAAEFLKKFPKINLILEVAEIFPDFSEKKNDIIFGFSFPGPDDFSRRLVTKTRYVICASEAYLKSKGTPQSPSELLQHPFICHSSRNPKDLILLDHAKSVQVRSDIFLNSTPLIVQAALGGLGLIWTHENMVEDLIKAKKLRVVLPEYTQQPINIFAYSLFQKMKDPKVRAFLDFFI
jgi:DNA-binding transcriptional LysR family regulator